MQSMKEEGFSQTVAIGAVKAVNLDIVNGFARIGYTLLNGSKGVVFTKRGQPKEYRIETALRYLRSLGVVSVVVDTTAWHLDQAPLL